MSSGHLTLDAFEKLNERYGDLLVERDRLRKALERIAYQDQNDAAVHSEAGMRRVAREALDA